MSVSKNQIEELRNAFLNEVSARENDSIHLKDLERVKTDDDWLRRFLLHQMCDVQNAVNMMWTSVTWRKENNVNEINETNVKMEILCSGAFFPHGTDIDKCILLIFKCNRSVKGTVDPDDLKRCVIYWFERLERLTKGNKITIFFDMEGCGLSNMDMDFIKYLIGLFKEYYPFFLNYIIIFEMPWILTAAFKIVKSWLPEKAIEKIKFVNKKDIKTYVPLDQALKSWGGENDYVFSFIPEDVPEKGKLVTTGNSAINNNKKVHFVDGSMSEISASSGDKEYDLQMAVQYLQLVEEQLNEQAHPSTAFQENNKLIPCAESSLWRSSKRPTKEDHNATLALIELRQHYDHQFKNKSKVKLDLWSKIAEELNNMGFLVGKGSAGRDRCKTRFNNLQNAYMRANDTRKRTGEGEVKQSQYYDELELIFGDKHKANPVIVIDSIKSPQSLVENSESKLSSPSSYIKFPPKSVLEQSLHSSPGPSCSSSMETESDSSFKDKENRFHKINRTLKPKSKYETFKEVVDFQKQSQQARREEFVAMLEVFNQQNIRRHEEMMALINRRSKKRRLSSESDNGGSLKVTPSGIITFVKDGNELVSTLELQNVDATAHLSYKLKTTSPEKFRVKPSTGCLAPGETTTVTVTLLPGFQLGGLSRDKFLVMSTQVDANEITGQDLPELWKNTSGRKVNQHRLKCIQSGEITKNGNIASVTPTQENDQNNFIRLYASVSQLNSSQNELQRAIKITQYYQLATIFFILVLGIALGYILRINFREISSNNSYCRDANHP